MHQLALPASSRSHMMPSDTQWPSLSSGESSVAGVVQRLTPRAVGTTLRLVALPPECACLGQGVLYLTSHPSACCEGGGSEAGPRHSMFCSWGRGRHLGALRGSTYVHTLVPGLLGGHKAPDPKSPVPLQWPGPRAAGEASAGPSLGTLLWRPDGCGPTCHAPFQAWSTADPCGLAPLSLAFFTCKMGLIVRLLTYMCPVLLLSGVFR